MIEGIRHTGIVVKNLRETSEFYLSLGFKIHSEATEFGNFIENVTGIKNANIKWVKMNLPDGNLLELIKYNFPEETSNKNKQKANQIGVSHLAFNVKGIDQFCENIIKLGGSIVNMPALTNNNYYKVAYCHDVEGNLFEVVEKQ